MSKDDKDELDHIDKQILSIKYKHRKMGVRKIGKLLEPPMSPAAVHTRMQKPKFKKYWEDLEKDVIYQIKEAQTEAMQVILETLRISDYKLRFQAAKTIIEPILQNCPQLLPDLINEEELEWDLQETEDG